MLPETNLTDSASLPEGALKTFPTPDGGPQVLLSRQQGQVHAFAPNCPHYGAPLEKGKVVAGRLICPWHHACFRLKDGQLCEPPALDDLPCYAVREAEGRIWVQVPANPPASTAKPDATPTAEVGGVPPAPTATPTDQRTFVIVGAGAAGQFAAQTLRREGFQGHIVLLTAEAQLPYDRTKLSKAYLAGKAEATALPLREKFFYDEQHIELLTNAEVTGVDAGAQEVQLAARPPLHYDQLLLAPGATPHTLPDLPGHDLNGVLPLRSRADADVLLDATREATQVVVVGASFIGMEAAASLAAEGRQVTVVAPEKVPFEKVLGPEIGAMFRQLHKDKGVRFETEAEVDRLLNEGNQVSAVLLKDGRKLAAQAVVLGVGVRPATGFLQGSLRLEKDGGLKTDECLQVTENVYAAGDSAAFPQAASGKTARIEHWRLAQQQGQVAARNMLGAKEKFGAVPFFWTQQFGKSLRYAGHADNWDNIMYHGEVAKQKFLAFYIQQGHIVAVAGMGRDDEMICLTELLAQNRLPTAAQLQPDTDWAALLP